MNCSKCDKELDKPIISISGSIMGDENTESFYFCDSCGVYTVAIFWDQFDGEESSSLRGPVSKEEGDKDIELIKKCATPWDKKCRCDAHNEYFKGSLD